MSTLEIILLALLLAAFLDLLRAHRLRRNAETQLSRCLSERASVAQNNYELRAKIVAFAMRNEDLENQISAIQSRRYERN